MPKIWKKGLIDKSHTIMFFVYCFVFCFFIIPKTAMHCSDCQNQYAQDEENILTFEADPLAFIPRNAVRVWEARDFLIVFGIPSVDIPMRRWRRHMQRSTCWNFPEVSTRMNNYTGAMLVLYILARHPVNNFLLSETLIEEAAQWHDIVIHPMNEGGTSTNKILKDKGWWGMEAEIASSRKTFFWFQFAVKQFPHVPYFAKGDDDTFIAVPLYLADLWRLPRKRVYWGRYNFIYEVINTKRDKGRIGYMLGYCFTLARDAAESFVSYKPMQRLVALPYNNKTEPEFIAMTMPYEDAMVGRLLQEVNFPVLYVAEGNSRFNTYQSLINNALVVAVHKPEEHEYYEYVNTIMIRKITPNATRIIKKGSDFYFMRPPLNI